MYIHEPVYIFNSSETQPVITGSSRSVICRNFNFRLAEVLMNYGTHTKSNKCEYNFEDYDTLGITILHEIVMVFTLLPQDNP